VITYVTGNLFLSPAQVLVYVNTVGGWAGVAYEFKRIYPEMFEQYRELYEHKLHIGELVYKSPTNGYELSTKKHWRIHHSLIIQQGCGFVSLR
jgi:hypothetical protein